jgi:hypothetical protein
MRPPVPAHKGAFAQSVHIPAGQSERPEHGVIVFAPSSNGAARSRASFGSERCARDTLPFFSVRSQESKRPHERLGCCIAERLDCCIAVTFGHPSLSRPSGSEGSRVCRFLAPGSRKATAGASSGRSERMLHIRRRRRACYSIAAKEQYAAGGDLSPCQATGASCFLAPAHSELRPSPARLSLQPHHQHPPIPSPSGVTRPRRCDNGTASLRRGLAV